MPTQLEFDPGIPIQLSESSLAFQYGTGTFGPAPEFRTLDAIRQSLRDPECDGPEVVYGIAMDIGRTQDLALLHQRMLLFGAVVYAAGRLGAEPVRSQGHIHAIAPHSGWSPPEIFEIWSGRAIIYAQERADHDPGHCVAVLARAGDQVVVPPRWAHCVINADPNSRMAFGAWCDRQYGFDYAGVRAHGGLAWFPILSASGALDWEPNPQYDTRPLDQHAARSYPELGLDPTRSLYRQFIKDPESVMFVAAPARAARQWRTLVP